MRIAPLVSVLGVAHAVACCVLLLPASGVAMEPLPAPTVSADPASGSLPLIGRVRATTPFCRSIVTDAGSLADNQLADIRTTAEAMRILAYAPLDRDIFTENRAVRALETLSARLTASRQGEAQVHVAGLRAAARGAAGEAPRPDLAHFASALDGAHSESSRVAKEISMALSVLEEVRGPMGGAYLPDDRMASDPRFAPAQVSIPFPVDADLEHFPAGYRVEDGPIHAYARKVALLIGDSLQQMFRSIDEARSVFPTAFDGCTEVDVAPSPAVSAQP